HLFPAATTTSCVYSSCVTTSTSACPSACAQRRTSSSVCSFSCIVPDQTRARARTFLLCARSTLVVDTAHDHERTRRHLELVAGLQDALGILRRAVAQRRRVDVAHPALAETLVGHDEAHRLVRRVEQEEEVVVDDRLALRVDGVEPMPREEHRQR